MQSALIFSFITAALIKFKEPARLRVAAAELLILVLGSAYIYCYFKFNLTNVARFSIVFNMVMFSLFLIICSADRKIVSVFIFLTELSLFAMVNAASAAITQEEMGALFLFKYIIVRQIIATVSIILMFKYVKPRFRKFVTLLGSEWRVLLLVPAGFMLLNTFTSYFPTIYWERAYYNGYIIFAASLLFFAAYYSLYVQCESTAEKYSVMSKARILSQQNLLWESELTRLRENIEESARRKHDMAHHDRLIMTMLNSGDIAELKAYMEKYCADTVTAAHTDFCANKTVNLLLNSYEIRAKNLGIEVRFDAELPFHIDIDSVDLTCIFANVLENAMTACMNFTGEQKFIHLHVKYMDGRMRLQVVNSCPDGTEFEGRLPLSKKDGGGVGTRSILYTAEKYDGIAEFFCNENEFTTKIVLNSKRER